MTLRDLSYSSIIKLVCFTTLTLPLLGILILLPFILFGHSSVTFDSNLEDLPKLFGIVGVTTTGPLLWVWAFFIYTINLFASSAALKLIAIYTPIGHVKIRTST